MSKIRVLIVDDAVVIRRIVTDVLQGDPEIEVVGTAANGKIGLARIPQLNPDLVTLDVEMPEMNGLETLKNIRLTHPRLPVIMFSTLTDRGASATLDALSAGASDYVTKPANVGSVSLAMDRIRQELIPKIKRLCMKVPAVVPQLSVPPAAHSLMVKVRPLKTRSLEAVVIGVSTGGPNALAEIIPKLPANLPVPILIVQHMPPVFTQVLAQRLNQRSALSVKEAKDGDPILAGNVYLAPGDWHMSVVRSGLELRVGLSQTAPENSCRPAADVLMRSAAAVWGPATLGVVLTGMGQDGLRGCEAIRDAGGAVFVQNEATSVVWGMPGFVSRAHLSDKEVPLVDVAAEITRRVMEHRAVRRVAV